jgi:hypothetical protein
MEEKIMTTRHTLSARVGIAITLGTARVTAGLDIAPYYDEDTDTVVYHFTGGPVTPSRPEASVPAASRFMPYCDEDTDTVVYRHVGRQATRRTAMMGAP